MPRHAISRDVKVAAIRLHERGLLDLEDILECCRFSERTWYRILKLWRTTGDVVSESTSLCGRLRILTHEDIRYLKFLINQNPDYFLNELLHLLKTNRFISLHYTTIHDELQRANVSRKKLQRVAKERNEERRADFIRRMAQYSPEELGFIDEVSRDERTIGRHYGRAVKGRRAHKQQPFVRGRRTSTVGVLSLDGFVARLTVEGSLTKVVLLEWLEHDVVRPVSFTVQPLTHIAQLPKCGVYPGPSSVLVLDNASIHHGEEILELADRFGVRIEYLPPYSPDLNPIEEAFSKIKHFLRQHQDYYYTNDGDTGHGLLYDMYEVLDIITDDDAAGYFAHSGYF